MSVAASQLSVAVVVADEIPGVCVGLVTVVGPAGGVVSPAGALLMTMGPKVEVGVEILSEGSIATTWKYHVPLGSVTVVEVPAVSTIESGFVPAMLSHTNEYPAREPESSTEVVQIAVSVAPSVVVAIVLMAVTTGADGGVVSTTGPATTFTVRVVVAKFPEKSCTEYVTVYVPSRAMFTGLIVTMLAVRFPSTPSIAVAPRSTYEVPTVALTVELPTTAMTGGVTSATGNMFTVRVELAIFPAASETV